MPLHPPPFLVPPPPRDPHERPPRGRHRATGTTPPAHRAAVLVSALRGAR